MTSPPLSTRWSRLLATVRRIVGMPDYEAYLRHVQECHPEREPLSRKAHFEEYVKRKYEGGGNRCC